MSNILDTPIEFLKGVGSAKAEILKKELEIFTYSDLLRYYPFRYIDRTKFYKIEDIKPDMTYIQIRGFMMQKQILVTPKAKQRLSVLFSDGKDKMELVWFKGINRINQCIYTGKEYIILGKPNYFNNKLNITHPEFELSSEADKATKSYMQPVYSSTERLGRSHLDSKGIMKLQHTLLKELGGRISENLPDYILKVYKMPSLDESIQQIHFPSDIQRLTNATRRLKFEELFFIQLKMLYGRMKTKQFIKGHKFTKVGNLFNTFYKDCIPFELTEAQRRVIKEIRKDTISGGQMNRLVQGDVGSGKTIVAIMAMLLSLDNGYQACLMAPTEILAMQHYKSAVDLLKNLGLKIGLLTGSTTKKERDTLLEQLKEGTLTIIIGTHALIEDQVIFKNLALAVIDEQHRFGVAQRAGLWKKQIIPPHVLVTTATPIPRTLAMTLYGDLDVSIIDQLPPGRKPIITKHCYEKDRLAVFGFLRKAMERGRQIYIVYPLIEESQTLDYQNLMTGLEAVNKIFPQPEYQISVVHGKMKAKDKEMEMERFKKKQTQIMVATTVIEVGVNVPNATVMVIENAERFGLSQLHQLRGRVGRASEQSYCILMTGQKLSADTKMRINTMVSTNDGFQVAEMDLKLRGPGNQDGTRQSGVLDLRIADLAKDQIILMEARKTAESILKDDPSLSKAENLPLKIFMDNRNNRSANSWSMIS